MLFAGNAQEKRRGYRTDRWRNPCTRAASTWIVKLSALVNHGYVYCVQRDLALLFLKFCSYFPYNGKVCLNTMNL